MKNNKATICILLALSIPFMLLAGCSAKDEEPEEEPDSQYSIVTDNGAPPSESETEPPSEMSTSGDTVDESPATGEPTGELAFSHSEGLDDNGFWVGIKALDYVEIFDYKAMPIPAEIHEVSDYDIQNEVDYILGGYDLNEHIVNRAVVNGDTVNIDYVGSVDGVEFDGGSTGGQGTYVIIGVTSYIDDFLEQLIGHMPGDTFNVEVTFPDDYQEEQLKGKDAVFVTTINFINGESLLDDDFVVENLSTTYGWTTVEGMREGLRDDLQKNSINQYIHQQFTSDTTVNSIPDEMTKYQEGLMINFFQEYANMYEMELDDFLKDYVGVADVDALKEANRETIISEATYALVIQAIAEDAGITVDEADLVKYLETDDYSSFVEQYGLPYLKQYALAQKVVDYVVDNAVLLQKLG